MWQKTNKLDNLLVLECYWIVYKRKKIRAFRRSSLVYESQYSNLRILATTIMITLSPRLSECRKGVIGMLMSISNRCLMISRIHLSSLAQQEVCGALNIILTSSGVRALCGLFSRSRIYSYAVISLGLNPIYSIVSSLVCQKTIT